jgi:hypothetical protein
VTLTLQVNLSSFRNLGLLTSTTNHTKHESILILSDTNIFDSNFLGLTFTPCFDLIMTSKGASFCVMLQASTLKKLAKNHAKKPFSSLRAIHKIRGTFMTPPPPVFYHHIIITKLFLRIKTLEITKSTSLERIF